MTLLTSRALIRLSAQGPQESPAAFLQGLVTNDVEQGPLPCWAGLLTPQGKVLFDFLVWQDGADLLIDCEAASADALVKRLSLYRLRRKIDLAREEALAVHWSSAPHDGAVPDPRLSALGYRWLAPATQDALPADATWLPHRLSLGLAEGVSELGDMLWLECNAVELNGVSFTKGCYVGQENTARMNWRQKVNRRLVVVPLSRSKPDRQRQLWPELGLALDHLRIDDITPDLRPSWLQLD